MMWVCFPGGLFALFDVRAKVQTLLFQELFHMLYLLDGANACDSIPNDIHMYLIPFQMMYFIHHMYVYFIHHMYVIPFQMMYLIPFWMISLIPYQIMYLIPFQMMYLHFKWRTWFHSE